jgi:hypothetical protein
VIGTMTFEAQLWLSDEHRAVHFVSLPESLADDIEAEHGHRAAGFGSLRVEVTIGASTWRTSVFPDTKNKTYVLPVKKPVRTAEGVAAGDTVTVELTVIA